MKSYKFKELDQCFRWTGYEEIRQTGSHHIYGRGSDRTEPIPNKIEEPIARRLIKKYDLVTSKEEFKRRKKENETMALTRKDARNLINGAQVIYKKNSRKYKGTVINTYDEHVLLSVVPMGIESHWGEPIPYKISVRYNNLNTYGEALYI